MTTNETVSNTHRTDSVPSEIGDIGNVAILPLQVDKNKSWWLESDILEYDQKEQEQFEIAESNRKDIVSQITPEILLELGVADPDDAIKSVQAKITRAITGKENEVHKGNIIDMFMPASVASAFLNDGEFDIELATTLMQVPRGSLEVASILPALAQSWAETTSSVSEEDWEKIIKNPNSRLPNILWVMVQPGNNQRPIEITNAELANEVFGAMLGSYEVVAKLIENGEYPETTHNLMQLICSGRPLDQVNKSIIALTVEEAIDNRLASDEELVKFSNILNRYTQHHGIDEQRIVASLSNILPRINDGSEVSKVLSRGGNDTTVAKDNFGRLDFYVHSLVTKATPLNIRELLSAIKDVPTIDVNNFEANRRDALVFAGPFRALRDLIHDQRPGVHDLLVAMEQYYKAESNEADEARIALETAVERCTTSDWAGHLDNVFDLSKYDEVTVTHNNPNNETNVQILRRLIDNTRPIPEEPPHVIDVWIQNALNEYWEDQSPRALAKITKLMREDLDIRYVSKQVGFEPSHIQALAWLDNQQRKYLAGLRNKPQRLILQDPVFLESLQFTMATTDAEYSPQEFEATVERLQDVTISADERKKIYLEKILKSLEGPVERYKKMGREDWVEALWSGNTLHEFTMLAQISDKSRVNFHEGD